MSAVCFELLFSGTARADAAAEPGQRLTEPGQTWHTVCKLRQLDLQFAFSGVCPRRENIQNQNRPVDHAHTDRILQIAQLHPGQLVVENDRICFHVLHHLRQLFHFSFSD